MYEVTTNLVFNHIISRLDKRLRNMYNYIIKVYPS